MQLTVLLVTVLTVASIAGILQESRRKDLLTTITTPFPDDGEHVRTLHFYDWSFDGE